MSRARKIELALGLLGIVLALTIAFAQNSATVGTITVQSGNVTTLTVPEAVGGYDLEENFEGSGYENSWTEVNGAPNEDQDTTGLSLEGSQCLYLTAEAGAENGYVEFTASDQAYAFFLLRWSTFPTTSARTQFGFGNGTDKVIQAINGTAFRIYSGGEDVNDTGGNNVSSTSVTLSIWFEYEKGTGADGVVRLFYAVDSTTKPGTPECEITTSDDTFQVSRFLVGNDWSGTAGDYYVDKLRISLTEAIGSDPL